ncbi:uncharacterized protein pim isoform X1 [Drosophila pseudoobscura]|uniref:Uncharacterized protein pim isoform X1 n=1 Tax=Drosophila pseudoobscura pseudoobscura TaxID=46245 RepID=A0A6I8VZQ3_DROPS|nr:uncharacterized protein LOC4811678 isoform X1 [Drosophila pseudoobscura]
MEQIFLAKENPVSSISIKKNALSINNSSIKQNARKLVLGKLENVMHQNQTPFKSDSISFPKSVAKLPLQNFHRNYDNERGEAILKVTPNYLGFYSLKNEICSQSAYENLFDYMDFSSTKCLNKCWRPLLFVANDHFAKGGRHVHSYLTIAEIWLDNQSGRTTFTQTILNDLGDLVETLETECCISIYNVFCDNFDRDNCSKQDIDNTGTEQCEYKLDSHMALPNLDDIDIPF